MATKPRGVASDSARALSCSGLKLPGAVEAATAAAVLCRVSAAGKGLSAGLR